MKILKSVIFRALCAIAIGVMLVKDPKLAQTGFIISIGILFLVSGFFFLASYYLQRRELRNVEILDQNGRPIKPQQTFAPIAGIGSVVLGLLLVIIPDTLFNIINYIFGAILLLGAFNQLINLLSIRKMASVPAFYWIYTSLILIAGITIILKPDFLAEMVIIACGWCFILYAVQEILIEVQSALIRHRFKKQSPVQTGGEGKKIELSD